MDAGLDCASTGCTAALSVTQSAAAAAVCGEVYVQYVFALQEIGEGTSEKISKKE